MAPRDEDAHSQDDFPVRSVCVSDMNATHNRIECYPETVPQFTPPLIWLVLHNPFIFTYTQIIPNGHHLFLLVSGKFYLQKLVYSPLDAETFLWNEKQRPFLADAVLNDYFHLKQIQNPFSGLYPQNTLFPLSSHY